MKIAIDLNGTAWFHKELFKELLWGLHSRGHEIGVLTANWPNRKEKNLEHWESLGYPEPEFYIDKDEKAKEIYKPLKGNNGLWKAEMVSKHEIDYLFCDLDENPDYVEAFIKIHPHKLIKIYGDEDGTQPF